MKETVVYQSDRMPINDNAFRGKITEDMDTLLLDEWKHLVDGWPYPSLSYLSKNNPETFIIHVPGCSRGCIMVDEDSVIKNIIIYPSKPCYKENAQEYLKKYIGVKIVCKGSVKNGLRI